MKFSYLTRDLRRRTYICMSFMLVATFVLGIGSLISYALAQEDGLSSGDQDPSTFIVKFRTQGPFALTENAHWIVADGLAFEDYLADGSQSIDHLNEKYGVQKVWSLSLQDYVHASDEELRLRDEYLEKILNTSSAAETLQADNIAEAMAHVYVFEISEKTDIEQICDSYQDDPHIVFAHPDFVKNDQVTAHIWQNAEEDDAPMEETAAFDVAYQIDSQAATSTADDFFVKQDLVRATAETTDTDEGISDGIEVAMVEDVYIEQEKEKDTTEFKGEDTVRYLTPRPEREQVTDNGVSDDDADGGNLMASAAFVPGLGKRGGDSSQMRNIRPVRDSCSPDPNRAYVKGRVIVKFKDSQEPVLENVGKDPLDNVGNGGFILGGVAISSPVQINNSGVLAAYDSINQINNKLAVQKAHKVFIPFGAAAPSTQLSLKQNEFYNGVRVRASAALKQVSPGRDEPVSEDADSAEEVLGLLENVYVLDLPQEADIEEAVRQYNADPNVEFAQPDYFMKLNTNDNYFNKLWALENTGQFIYGGSGTPDADIDAVEAWAMSEGEGIVVAINDTGIEYDHQDLVNQMWINSGEDLNHNGVVDGVDHCPTPNGDFNCVDDDGNGYVDDLRGYDFSVCSQQDSDDYWCWPVKDEDNDPMDYYGHGTHVAGTIAAEGDNYHGVVGVAPKAKVMAVKGFTDDTFGTSYTLANGLVYAAMNGADIINNSWGCSFPCPSDPIVENAVRFAHNLGVVVVFSAGNNDDDVDEYSPQNMAETITVASSDYDDERSSFSAYGSSIDVTAPGETIASTYMGDDYVYMDGTSMAAPHVCGVAALILSYHAAYNFTNEEVRNVLRFTADDINTSGWDQYTGWGRINAYNAMTLSALLPVLNPIGDRNVDAGQLLEFTVTASDPQGNVLTLTARLPNGDPLSSIGATFVNSGDGSSGIFSWTPALDRGGASQYVLFEVMDPDYFIDSELVRITINAVAYCGDGHLDPGEQCDDGNTTGGDGCSAICNLEECGNAIVDPGEDCDDGNLDVGDGCNDSCEIEACGNGVVDSGEQCDDGNTVIGDGCSDICNREECGNGIADPGEQCDDGNTAGGDGCSATCRIEECGNGVVDPGEQCDDGNTVKGDGCSDICNREECGNGIMDPGEECDDGNTTGGDGCSAVCALEECGNSVVDVGEECDDGNIVDGDGCSAMCLLEAVCGDGIVGRGEQCDDGNTTGGDGCSAVCWLEECGNGILDPGEECDDGNTIDGDRCDAGCHIEPYCGDGNLDAGEQCDDGNNSGGDGCSAICNREECGNAIVDPGEQCDDGNTDAADGCSATCILEECGNGIIDPGEQCDDGNTDAADGCSGMCLLEVCGNGIVDPREQCDDGNTDAADGCSASCILEECGNGIVDPGEQCDDGNTDAADGCSASCILEECGNGIVDPGEQCDDGNTDAADGCSATCILEECGNGIVDPGEECDDGNTRSGDHCDSSCQAEPYCGDGNIDIGEQCDDGNNAAGDGCSPICNHEVCGNGYLDPPEECDDGNTISGDKCDATCHVEYYCGDGVCNGNETYLTCRTDCGDYRAIGDGYVDDEDEDMQKGGGLIIIR